MHRRSSFRNVASLCLLAIVIGITGAGVLAQSEGDTPPTPSPLTQPSAVPMVSTAWLADHFSDSAIVLIDARPALRDFLTGHIAGAQMLTTENLRSSAGGVPGELYPRGVLMQISQRLGIWPASHVVVYGAENDPDAAFVAFGFETAGFSATVSILDGGLRQWTAEKHPVTVERTIVRQSSLRNGSSAPETTAGYAEVRGASLGSGSVIVDARPADQFVAGHIPGAVNRFWKEDLQPEGGAGAGLLRGKEDLAKAYAALGITPDKPVIVYCNSGHMASLVYRSLHDVLAYPNVRLYDGSWLEWSITPDAAKETGPAKKRQD